MVAFCFAPYSLYGVIRPKIPYSQLLQCAVVQSDNAAEPKLHLGRMRDRVISGRSEVDEHQGRGVRRVHAVLQREMC